MKKKDEVVESLCAEVGKEALALLTKRSANLIRMWIKDSSCGALLFPGHSYRDVEQLTLGDAMPSMKAAPFGLLDDNSDAWNAKKGMVFYLGWDNVGLRVTPYSPYYYLLKGKGDNPSRFLRLGDKKLAVVNTLPRAAIKALAEELLQGVIEDLAPKHK